MPNLHVTVLAAVASARVVHYLLLYGFIYWFIFTPTTCLLFSFFFLLLLLFPRKFTSEIDVALNCLAMSTGRPQVYLNDLTSRTRFFVHTSLAIVYAGSLVNIAPEIKRWRIRERICVLK